MLRFDVPIIGSGLAGYNVARVKAVVFSISAAMAGLAGALFVPQVGAITPTSLGIVPSIEYVLLVALIALLCLAAVMWFGSATSNEFDDVSSTIGTA